MKMKKYYTLLILLLSFWSNAQNGITYQAVILNPNTEELPGADNSRLPLVNQKITLEFKILNATSNIDYQETINTETDDFGMVNVVIGTGTRKAGIATQFSGINWDGSAKTLIVSLDPSGQASHFIEISNQPFTYVPFALYAAHTGVAGTQGPAGNNGLDGKTVLNGATNPSVSIGANGDFYINTATSSLFGPKTNGVWGNSVPLVGPQGIQGPQGVAGTNGINGTNGLSAYQIWLNTGNTGTEAQFLTALRGATGAQGPQGIQGVAGPAGSTGTAGTNGVNGQDGQDGLSAYQIWLNAGNTGTEAQFLTALRGATGAQGAQGIQGPIGPTGATGPQGIAGTNGSTWLSGTTSPNTNIGAINDFYLNTTNGEYFKKTADNLWTQQGNLTGPAGTQGTSNSNGTANSIYWFKYAGVANSYMESNINWSDFKYSTGFSSNNDVIHDSTTGEITFTKSGVYKIEYFVPGGGNQIFQGIQLLNYKNTTWNILTGVNARNMYGYQEFRSDGVVLSVSAGEKIKIRVDGNAYEITVIISETGVTGPQGPAGANGSNGQDGLSAYQIWLNAGNTGTEAQFLTALRGATGAQGIQGGTGPQGIAGTNGTNGLDGKTVLNGTQSPTAGIGNNGDFYINTTTNTLFGPKTSGTWGSGVALVGPQGAAGTNGKNTLVNTTTEAAGANCATGGTKVEVGLDTNNNGILDSGEVNSSLTKYVCNGVSSSSSNHGVWTWTNGNSFIVPAGISSLMIEFQGVSGGHGANAYLINGVYTYTASAGDGGGTLNTKLLLINLNPGDLLSINNSLPGINSSSTSSCSVCGTGCNVICSGGDGGSGELTNLTLNGNIISSISGGIGGEGGKVNLLYGGNGTHNGAIGNYGVISLNVNHIALLSQTQIASSLSPKLVINY